MQERERAWRGETRLNREKKTKGTCRPQMFLFADPHATLCLYLLHHDPPAVETSDRMHPFACLFADLNGRNVGRKEGRQEGRKEGRENLILCDLATMMP